MKIASYRSPIGKIAAQPAGGEIPLPVGGREQWVTVKSSTKLDPFREGGVWDSRNNRIDLGPLGKATIVSLRALLEKGTFETEKDILAEALAKDEPFYFEGIRRDILVHIGLRDEPILDQFQDAIFRLPIHTCCFLSGPPGTGKTTTLIRRLGQKLDWEVLEPEEQSQLQQVGQDSAVAGDRSWIMFSPTELLRQYVKEAFAKEGIAASDHHIRTWVEHRHDLARNVLGLLRTGTGRGQFVTRPDDAYLETRCGASEAAGWFEDFDGYFRRQLQEELCSDAEWLADSGCPELVSLGRSIVAALAPFVDGIDGTVAPELAAFRQDIQALLVERRNEFTGIIDQELRRILREDRSFLDSFAQEIARDATLTDDGLDDDDEDADADLEDEEESEGLPTRTISIRQARSQYERVIRSFARARARGRRMPEKARNGRLLAWLGEARVPSKEQLEHLARIAGEQVRLRRFSNIDALLLRSISRLFKRFRRERVKEGRWYVSEPARSRDICWKEIDLVILAILKMAGSIFSAYGRSPRLDAPVTSVLGNISACYRNQVLVDEATDFSVIQLAIMHELAHPALKSFFACGDFNQRLTSWGIASDRELNWVDPDIQRHRITVSYRQSARLVELAKRVAELGGSSASDIVLPDRLDTEGVPPVWATHLGRDKDIAAWLVHRIREIERTLQKIPSIAVLVSDEARVVPLAAHLDEALQLMNLRAAACKDGKVVGSDQDVRIFSLEHIKGMEFEAVFFVDLCAVVAGKPDLFAKYLYVGATRAATYLGITFKTDVPEEVAPLSDLFGDSWAF